MAKATNEAYAYTSCEYRLAADEHSPHVEIVKYVDESKRVLDVGCATGYLAGKLAEAVADRDGEASMTVSDGFNLAHVTEGVKTPRMSESNITFELGAFP